MTSFQTIDPRTGEALASFPAMSWDEVERRAARASETFRRWRATSLTERCDLLNALAERLTAERRDLGELATVEMGKPIKEALAEVDKCASVARYYASEARAMLEPELVATDARKSYVAFEPLGTVFAVMPWNFPYWQVFRFAVPTVTAGNVALVKHAANVPQVAAAIERLFKDAGYPEGVVTNLFIDHDTASRLIASDHVAAVTLTGSTRAGRSVAARAGEALKKCVLELGGSDPYVVLGDADLDLAVEQCVKSRLINSGQSCIAAKRFIVEQSIAPAFTERFVRAMAAKRMGDPHRDDTDIGPLARHDLRDEVHDQVQRSIARGARCLLGGTLPGGPGAFYPPTVLTDVGPGMAAFDEEIFGPVAAIVTAKDEADAVRLANLSRFGLGSAVFTRDLARAERLATSEIEAGQCFINSFVRSDPRLPFGGIKESGYGRELYAYGIKEFVNIKTIYVA